VRSSKGLGGRRKLLAGIVTVGLTLGGSAAYAFWSGGGPAEGFASTGSSGGGVLQIQQVLHPINLTPGGAPQSITVTVTNPDPINAVVLDDLLVGVDPSWSEQSDGEKPPCTVTDFITTGSGGGFTVGPATARLVYGTIRMIDKPAAAPNSNQDNCKGVDVDLIFTPVPRVAG
jgi:hypothetical protein